MTEAKRTLWKHFKDNIQFSFQERKSTEKRSAVEANLDDVLRALGDLDAASIPVTFVAKELNRIPRSDTEEQNVSFLLEHVNNIERRL